MEERELLVQATYPKSTESGFELGISKLQTQTIATKMWTDKWEGKLAAA